MRKSKLALPAWILFTLMAAVFGTRLASAQGTTLQVAAAADLEPVLPPVLEDFQKATGIHVDVTYDESAALATQIEGGAPFDVFLSGDLTNPQKLIVEGLAMGNTLTITGAGSEPTVYAKGKLVLWARKDSSLPAPSLDLLRSPDLKKLAIVNPDLAPYGPATVTTLRKLKLYDQLAPKFLKAANVATAAQYADAGNADAALISLTAARAGELSVTGTYFEIPRNLYKPIEQGAVVINRSGQLQYGHRFINFLLSAPVQAKLAANGLTPAH